MNKENCIEWLTGDDTMTLSLTNKRFISRVKQIIQEKPESGEIIAENGDGSICAHLSIRALHLFYSVPKNDEFSGDLE